MSSRNGAEQITNKRISRLNQIHKINVAWNSLVRLLENKAAVLTCRSDKLSSSYVRGSGRPADGVVANVARVEKLKLSKMINRRSVLSRLDKKTSAMA